MRYRLLLLWVCFFLLGCQQTPIDATVRSAGEGDLDAIARMRQDLAERREILIYDGARAMLSRLPTTAEVLDHCVIWPVDDFGQPAPIFDMAMPPAELSAPHVEVNASHASWGHVSVIYEATKGGKLGTNAGPPSYYVSPSAALSTYPMSEPIPSMGMEFMQFFQKYHQAHDKWPATPKEAFEFAGVAVVKRWEREMTRRWDVWFYRHPNGREVGMMFLPRTPTGLMMKGRCAFGLFQPARGRDRYSPQPSFAVNISPTAPPLSPPRGATLWMTWAQAGIPTVDLAPVALKAGMTLPSSVAPAPTAPVVPLESDGG